MSFLTEYEERTSWKYEPIRGSFPTNDVLPHKVDMGGKFLPFRGSTVVFRLDVTSIRILRLMRSFLYRGLVDTGMLSQALPASTFHMTLHDLVSPDRSVSPPSDRAAYMEEVKQSLFRARETVAGIHDDFAGRKLRMKADRIVNLVSTAVVLMVKPSTEEDYAFLMELYRRFEPLMPLPYPLTPHITLAYFRPGEIDGDRLGAAISSMQINAASPVEFELPVEALTAQYFRDMQHFEDVPLRICFCCDGGLIRSVMAACILNHIAGEERLPLRGFARAAYGNTRGREVSEDVWKTLERHGIEADRSFSPVVYLEAGEAARFSRFALLSDGAADRIVFLGIAKERYEEISSFFRGVPNPTGPDEFEALYHEIYRRVKRFLEDWKRRYMIL